MRKTIPIKQRFEKYFIPEPNSGCWIWVGAMLGKERGGFRMGPDKNFVKIAASRASWLIYKGEIEDGLLVCHKCDVPFCVNPDHLFLGTHKDNTIDMVNKNRHFKKKQTHCPNGHEYTKENTGHRKDNGTRWCRSCDRTSAKLKFQRKKLKNKVNLDLNKGEK